MWVRNEWCTEWIPNMLQREDKFCSSGMNNMIEDIRLVLKQSGMIFVFLGYSEIHSTQVVRVHWLVTEFKQIPGKFRTD